MTKLAMNFHQTTFFKFCHPNQDLKDTGR